MKRPAWMVAALGAAVTSLAIGGAGAAMAQPPDVFRDGETPPPVELPVGDLSAEDARLFYQFPIKANEDGGIAPSRSILSWYVGL